MLIKDLETGIVREYGKDCHDSLAISPDGRTLSYYNLQCGEGSRYGCFRFVMEDGKVPDDSKTPDAIHAECYFNIGGFPNVKQIRKDAINECIELVIKTCFVHFPCDDETIDFYLSVKQDVMKRMEQLKEQK